MSTLIAAFHAGYKSKAMPVQQSLGLAHQLRLPFDGVRKFGVVLGGLFRQVTRRRANGIVYFGNRRQFFAIGTTVRRVGSA